MSEQMAKKQQWCRCTADEIAWLGIDVRMKNFMEVANWLEALARSGGCGFHYPGDAFCDSTNSLATWMSCLSDKIRKMAKESKANPINKESQNGIDKIP